MSNYKDFIKDFPCRCNDVLGKFFDPAEKNDREVTLLLMATATGFIMPYERLSEGRKIKQPPLDRNRFVEASKKLNTLLTETIAQSMLFEGLENSWYGGPLESAEGTPDTWPEYQTRSLLSPKTSVSDAVSYVRHGLAHGNVFTCPGSDGQISELIFLCGGTLPNGKKIPLKFVAMSPVALRQFLDNWFKFVSGLPVPQHTKIEMVNASM